MTGMNLRQIAEWTGLKEKSVNDYKKRVMRKVGVKNNKRNEDVVLAKQTSI